MNIKTAVVINTHALTDAPINPEDKQLDDGYSLKKIKIGHIANDYMHEDRQNIFYVNK